RFELLTVSLQSTNSIEPYGDVHTNIKYYSLSDQW
ncbi:unnamed protein product, partial [Rotaria magnacalcarata]